MFDTRVTEEAVIGLGPDSPGSHLFGQAMGWGEDEGVSCTEELDCSRGFATASAAGEVGESMLGEGIVVERRGALGEVLFCCFVFWLGEVGCVFHRHVEALALVAPLGRLNLILWRPRSCLVVVGETDATVPLWAHKASEANGCDVDHSAG